MKKIIEGNSLDVSRRSFLRSIICGAAVVSIAPLVQAMPSFAAEAKEAAKPAPKKPLVVYFSHSGHTKAVAEELHKQVGGDIIQIETVNPYPADYDKCLEVAKAEKQKNARPAIKTKIPNIDEYGVVFLGFPCWYNDMPMPVYTFVEQNKLDGKKIAPFNTHGGDGIAKCVEGLKKAAPKAQVLKPLAVPSKSSSSAGTEIKNWLEGLGPALIETTVGSTKIYPDGAY